MTGCSGNPKVRVADPLQPRLGSLITRHSPEAIRLIDVDTTRVIRIIDVDDARDAGATDGEHTAESNRRLRGIKSGEQESTGDGNSLRDRGIEAQRILPWLPNLSIHRILSIMTCQYSSIMELY